MFKLSVRTTARQICRSPVIVAQPANSCLDQPANGFLALPQKTQGKPGPMFTFRPQNVVSIPSLEVVVYICLYKQNQTLPSDLTIL